MKIGDWISVEDVTKMGEESWKQFRSYLREQGHAVSGKYGRWADREDWEAAVLHTDGDLVFCSRYEVGTGRKQWIAEQIMELFNKKEDSALSIVRRIRELDAERADLVHQLAKVGLQVIDHGKV